MCAIRRGLVLVLALLAVGCRTTPAQLVVVVDSDYPPGGLTHIGLNVVDPSGGAAMDDRMLEVVQRAPASGQVTIPFSFGVLPPGGDASRSVRVEVRGFDEDLLLVTRVAQTGFRKGAILRLPMFLARACQEVWRGCPEGQTCVVDCSGGACEDAACRSDSVPPDTLEEVEPGREIDAGGPVDAADAVDASEAVDGGGMDATVDAAAGDAGNLDGGATDAGTADAAGSDAGPLARSGRRVTAGAFHTCLHRSDGTVSCWGNNEFGQLGDGTTAMRAMAVTASALGVVDAVVTDGGDLFGRRPTSAHTCILRGTTVSCLGGRVYGEVGDTISTTPATSLFSTSVTDAVAVGVGDYHSCAVTSAGRVSCWGRNLHGALGFPLPPEDRETPMEIPGLSNVVDVVGGQFHTCALHSDGTVSCWGSNGDGQQSGEPPFDMTRPTPVRVSMVSDATELCAANWNTCAIRSTGAATCWGNGDYIGASGLPAIPQAPTDIDLGGDRVVSLGCGNEHTCVATASGNVWCFGENRDGQLGRGPPPRRSEAPVQVMSETMAVEVASGYRHSCALRRDGSVGCWGGNDHNQLAVPP